MKKRALLLLLPLLHACSTSSTGRNQVMLYSHNDMDKMGAASFEQMKKDIPISSDKQTNDFVQCVADAMTINVPKSVHKGSWEVIVFDSNQVNAFALPGGKIGVYTGILNVTENADQLAAIMGHEIGHVIEHHSNERMSTQKITNTGMMITEVALSTANVEEKGMIMGGLGLGMQYGVSMPFGREHESEADIVGQKLMAQSGFNPAASIKLWQNMAKLSKNSPPEFMSTHPSNDTRIKQLSEHLANANKYFDANKLPSCKKPKVIN